MLRKPGKRLEISLKNVENIYKYSCRKVRVEYLTMKKEVVYSAAWFRLRGEMSLWRYGKISIGRLLERRFKTLKLMKKNRVPMLKMEYNVSDVRG